MFQWTNWSIGKPKMLILERENEEMKWLSYYSSHSMKLSGTGIAEKDALGSFSSWVNVSHLHTWFQHLSLNNDPENVGGNLEEMLGFSVKPPIAIRSYPFLIVACNANFLGNVGPSKKFENEFPFKYTQKIEVIYVQWLDISLYRWLFFEAKLP